MAARCAVLMSRCECGEGGEADARDPTPRLRSHSRHLYITSAIMSVAQQVAHCPHSLNIRAILKHITSGGEGGANSRLT